MRPPLIGISGSIICDDHGTFIGYPRSYANHDYVRSVVENGGIPIILPFHENDTIVKEIISKIDGLILTGGHDVYPLNFGQEPLPCLGNVWPERDHYDFTLLATAEQRGIPIMAICRGHQLVNVYHGGTLFQDLSYDKNCTIKHSQDQRPDLPTHTIFIENNSKLAKIIGKPEIVTNSHHHQTVDRIGASLRVTAVAKDGTIEAMESIDYPGLVTYQFHPEMMSATSEDAKKLFVAFIKETIKSVSY